MGTIFIIITVIIAFIIFWAIIMTYDLIKILAIKNGYVDDNDDDDNHKNTNSNGTSSFIVMTSLL